MQDKSSESALSPEGLNKDRSYGKILLVSGFMELKNRMIELSSGLCRGAG